MADLTDPSLPDVVHTYHRLLHEDPDLTMPVAAIEALILRLSETPASTISETLDLISTLTKQLKTHIPNSISLSAGTDLFQQYLITSLQRPTGSAPGGGGGGGGAGDFEQVRAHLVQNGKLFVERAKAARETIAGFGRHLIRDGDVILTNGGSRVVGALLRSAAEAGNGNGRGSVRFRVIYVVSSDDGTAESAEHIAALRERDIPVATIPATAVAFAMGRVTRCFVGAEGVVENGGVISRLGTFQMGMLAKSLGKPFYVVSESHKFVRLYPVGQDDLGFEQSVVEFRTLRDEISAREEEGKETSEEDGNQNDENKNSSSSSGGKVSRKAEEAVDYTPPHLISGIITESGVLLPSAVSEELIKIWY
jgi:translation initiation factor eIF-2B subunit alpha